MELHVKRILDLGVQYFRTFSWMCVCILICIVLDLFLKGYVNSLEERCEDLAPLASYVQSLNAGMVNFIQKHHMSGSGKAPVALHNLIDNYSEKYKMKIVKYETTEQLSYNGVSIEKYRIEILSWHDSYIFEIIKKMCEFSPGFISFEKINISRISKINLKSPSIRAVLLCDLYYKN
jgi:hypothetical protein